MTTVKYEVRELDDGTFHLILETLCRDPNKKIFFEEAECAFCESREREGATVRWTHNGIVMGTDMSDTIDGLWDVFT